MKKYLSFLFVFLVCFNLFSCFVFADEIIENPFSIETVETVGNEVIQTSDDSEILNDSEFVDNESQNNELELLESINSRLEYIISIIYVIIIFFTISAIYKTLYRLFSFVI